MTIGLKDDKLKPRWELLPLDACEQVVNILTFGAKKYAPNNWQLVEDAENRYYAALMRHLKAWRSGEERCPESGELHLAHAGCNVIFLLWFAISKPKGAA